MSEQDATNARRQRAIAEAAKTLGMAASPRRSSDDFTLTPIAKPKQEAPALSLQDYYSNPSIDVHAGASLNPEAPIALPTAENHQSEDEDTKAPVNLFSGDDRESLDKIQKNFHSIEPGSPRGQVATAVAEQSSQKLPPHIAYQGSEAGDDLLRKRNATTEVVDTKGSPVARAGVAYVPDTLPASDTPERQSVVANLGKQTIANHELEHATNQPKRTGKDSLASDGVTPEDSLREIGPSVGDIVFRAEQFEMDEGKPLDLEVELPGGKTHDVKWMQEQARQHGYFDGKSMHDLVFSTDAGQQWAKQMADRQAMIDAPPQSPEPQTVPESIDPLPPESYKPEMATAPDRAETDPAITVNPTGTSYTPPASVDMATSVDVDPRPAKTYAPPATDQEAMPVVSTPLPIERSPSPPPSNVIDKPAPDAPSLATVPSFEIPERSVPQTRQPITSQIDVSPTNTNVSIDSSPITTASISPAKASPPEQSPVIESPEPLFGPNETPIDKPMRPAGDDVQAPAPLPSSSEPLFGPSELPFERQSIEKPMRPADAQAPAPQQSPQPQPQPSSEPLFGPSEVSFDKQKVDKPIPVPPPSQTKPFDLEAIEEKIRQSPGNVEKAQPQLQQVADSSPSPPIEQSVARAPVVESAPIDVQSFTPDFTPLAPLPADLTASHPKAPQQIDPSKPEPDWESLNDLPPSTPRAQGPQRQQAKANPSTTPSDPPSAPTQRSGQASYALTGMEADSPLMQAAEYAVGEAGSAVNNLIDLLSRIAFEFASLKEQVATIQDRLDHGDSDAFR